MLKITRENILLFAEYFKKFSTVFQGEFNKDLAQKIKPEIDSFDKEVAIALWSELIKSDCPVEDLGNGIYEIHDIVNYKGEGSFDEYIHRVEIKEDETTSSVFMKFYYVLYCIINNIKSKALT